MNSSARSTVAERLRKAQALRAQGQHHDMLECLEVARRAAADDAVAHSGVGDFYSLLEDYQTALAEYDTAVQLEPRNVRFRFNRAAVRRFLGQLEAAELDYDAVIAATPEDAEAWRNRSELRVQSTERNHVVELERWVSRGFASWQQEVPVRYALAKEYEDIGCYRDSWRHLQAGASVRRAHLQYDLQADLATVEWIRQAFPTVIAHTGPQAASGPIFIVGMPRTGTTLLERILGGQREVYPAGELVDLAAAVVAAARSVAGRADLPRRELIMASARADFSALGTDYLTRVRRKVGRYPRFIDKMPLNYLYCGLIQRALPGARILHVTRHPLATCHAIYKTLFDRGYPFSYDLGELADYFVGYHRLMAHWHTTLPGRILDVPYERLVTDSAAEGQRIFSFCDLEWDPACLEIQSSAWQSTTASASQVRRPIYRDSVERWRQYAEELAPVGERLAAAGIRWEE